MWRDNDITIIYVTRYGIVTGLTEVERAHHQCQQLLILQGLLMPSQSALLRCLEMRVSNL